MSMSFGSWVRLVCAVWVGVMAGFFFAFSFVVMPGLGAMEPLAALASMQAINLAVRNAVFALGFFGALILCIAASLHALLRPRRTRMLVRTFRRPRLPLGRLRCYERLQRAPERRNRAPWTRPGPRTPR